MGGHIAIPDEITLRIEYQKHADALGASSYPGVELISEKIVEYKTNDVTEMVRAYNYMV